MDTSRLRRPLWAFASVLLLSVSGQAAAEPPSRAARLGYLSGTVSFSPAGQPDWVRAAVNRPLTTGDRLWTGGSSRAELQIGGAAIRMGPSTSMVLLNLDDRITQVQLSQGTLKIRVRSLGPRQTFEVATPNLAFTLRRPGDYRIEVDPNDDATAAMVRYGEAEVYGQGASYTVDSRRAYRFYGNDLSDYEALAAQRDDDLDRWSGERDRRGDSSVSARYVSSEVVGYEDLDANGSWRVDATYGSVWTPTRVASGWTPYRDGHWSWVDPWGWTWVDDAPWGYAVSHYGRWANINNTWAWVPGPRRERAVYAPALVAFIGGRNFQVSVSVGGASAANVGWFPLAPREVYQPSYPVSRTYFDNINRSNAVIAPTTITNVYNTTIVNNTSNVTQVSNVVYANQLVTGAVVAVPTQAFVQSQPVAKASVQLPREVVVSAPVLRVASVAPVQQSVQGGAIEAAAKPPTLVQAVVARTAPPPAPLPFAAQQSQLAARPGTPIDDAQRTQLKPAVPAVVAPKVSVVAAAPVPTATALPPATPPAGKSPQERKAAAAIAAGGGGEGRRPDADKAAGATADAARADAARADAAKIEAAKTDAARVDAAKAGGARAEESKAAATKAEAAKAADVKAEALKAEAARAEAAKADTGKAAAVNTATANAEAAKAAALKADAARAAEAKAAEARSDATRASNAKVEAGKADEAKAERAKADSARADAAKAEAAKAEAARAEAAKAANLKADAARAEAAKADASKAAAAQAATATAEASKAAADRAEAARAAEAKADATRASNAKAEAGKADEARAERARGEAAKAEASKAEAMKAEAARADAAKAATAKAEAVKAEANRADAARAAALKAQDAKAEAAKADAARADAARAGQAKAEAAKAEAAKAEAARADAGKAAAAKAAAAKAEADRVEAARAAAVAKAPPAAEAPPPKARASGPKLDADPNDAEDGKRKEGRKS